MVAAAVIGGAVIGAGASTISSNKAAGASKRASDQAVTEQQRQYDTTRADTANLRALSDTSVAALSKLQTGDMSGFYKDPGYQFSLDQGAQTAQRAATAQGRSMSGAEDKALVRYGTGVAEQQYGNYVDRLLQSAGLGNTGIGASASAGANAANNIGNAYLSAGNARAGAYLTAGQGINNAVQGGISNILLQKYLTGGGATGGTQSTNWGYSKPSGYLNG